MNTVYKIRYWDENFEPTLYIFIGEGNLKYVKLLKNITKNEEEIHKKFGDNYSKLLGLDIQDIPKVYIPKTIYSDDTINILQKKLLVYLHEYLEDINYIEDIYLWSERTLKKNQNIDFNFIEHCFKKESKIKYEYFEKCVKYYFNITLNESGYYAINHNIAYKLLQKHNKVTITEPLIYKYMYANHYEFLPYNPIKYEEKISSTNYIILNQGSLLISSFELENNIIDMIFYRKSLKYYFPYHSNNNKAQLESHQSFINKLDEAQNEITNYTLKNKYHIENYFSFFNFKVNKNNINNINNLSKLFDALQTAKNIPIITFKTTSNIYYKLFKPSLLTISSKNIDKWTTYNSTHTIKLNNTNYISVKYLFGIKSYCTFLITDTFEFDIKLNLSIEDKIKFNDIKNIYTFLNETFIKTAQSIYPDNIIPNIDKSNIEIVNISSYNNLSIENKLLSVNNIKNIIKTKFNPYFNIIDINDKNFLHLQYKKVDHYTKYNIENFIQKNLSLGKDELINLLMTTFLISKEDSEKEYDKANKEITDKLYIKNYDNLVTIKLKISDIGNTTKFSVDRFNNMIILEKISSLLEILFDYTDQNIYVKNANKFEEFDNVNIHDNLEIIEDSLIEDDDQDVLELFELAKESEETTKQDTPVKSVSKLTKPTKMLNESLIINLKYADPDLFGKPLENQKDYARACQKEKQPIVISPEEKKIIDKNYPDSYDNSLQTGSTPELAAKNIYICPRVWCPKSRVSLSPEQFQKLNNKCPGENEVPQELYNHKYWHSSIETPRYIGFLKDKIHPDNICVPCCNKLQKDKPNKTCKTNQNKSSDDKILSVKKQTNEKYIVGTDSILSNDKQYGLPPKDFNDLLDNKLCGVNGQMIKGYTNCYLRKGTLDSSFLSAVISLFKLNIKTEDYIKIIKNNIDVINFVALENGKLIKLFVNPEFDIHIKEHFKEFKIWFLKEYEYSENKYAKETYISKYDLYHIAIELKNNTDIFSSSIYKHIIREFIIYNGYKHFIEFLESDVVKDHKTMLDLINFGNNKINPDNIHIIIVEYNNKTKQSNILCPFNKKIDDNITLNNNFSIIIKNNNYYEPLFHIEYPDGESIISTSQFLYKDSDISMRKFISIYLNNCSVPKNTEKNGESISLYLRSIGYKTRSFVIDFNFRITGILLNNLLYIPLKNKMDMYNVLNKKFIYYNEIPRLKCHLAIEKIQDIFRKLNKFTNDDFYKIKKVIQFKNNIFSDKINLDESYDVIILKNNNIIPLRLDKKKSLKYYLAFEQDLDIFIEHQDNDKRKNIIDFVREEIYMFDIIFENILTYINENNDLRIELNFITDKYNPFPKNFKREKLYDIITTIANKLIIKNDSVKTEYITDKICSNPKMNEYCLDPCIDNPDKKCIKGIPQEYLVKFIGKLIETFLLNRYQNKIIKNFKKYPNEAIIDQNDVNNKVIDEIIEFMNDPYKLISEKLEYIEDNYISDKLEYYNLYKIYKDEEKVNLSIIMNKYLNKNTKYNFELINIKNYNSLHIYSLFLNINKYLYPKKTLYENEELDINLLKGIIKSQIIENKTIPEYHNPSLNLITKLKKEKITINDYLGFIDNVNYYPSFFEIQLLGFIIGVNIVITGNVTKLKKNYNKPELQNLHFYDSKSKYTIFLDCKHGDNKDIFRIYVRNNSIIFKNTELSQEIWKFIKESTIYQYIEVQENDNSSNSKSNSPESTASTAPSIKPKAKISITKKIIPESVKPKEGFKKTCPKGKILNPETDRCIDIKGKIAKALFKKYPDLQKSIK